jgi:hypothetical protein
MRPDRLLDIGNTTVGTVDRWCLPKGLWKEGMNTGNGLRKGRNLVAAGFVNGI